MNSLESTTIASTSGSTAPPSGSTFNTIPREHYEDEGTEKYLKRLGEKCFISVIRRFTGFGFWEWESALFHPMTEDCPDDARNQFDNDHECYLIRGDRRADLESLSETEVLKYFRDHIHEKNTADTIFDSMKKVQAEYESPEQSVPA